VETARSYTAAAFIEHTTACLEALQFVDIAPTHIPTFAELHSPWLTL
jgi:hypothetical protein